MSRHSRKHNRQFYTYGATKIPNITQDRYYAQDYVRDMRYNEGLAARAVLDLLQVTSALLSGGTVTQGSSVTKLNITAAVGACEIDIEVPNDDLAWVVPAPYETRQIAVTARSPALTDFDLSATSMNFDGVTANYLKLRYVENNVRTRTRKYGGTSYAYSIEDSYSLLCDSTVPVAKDVLLATLVGNGSSILTITQNATASVIKATSATSATSATNATTATNATLAASATKLQTARKIASSTGAGAVSFDGTSDVTIPVGDFAWYAADELTVLSSMIVEFGWDVLKTSPYTATQFCGKGHVVPSGKTAIYTTIPYI